MASHVWQQVVHAIDISEPINEGTVGDMFEEACEAAQVPSKVLLKYRIVKVEAPEAGVALFVVRERKGSSSSGSQAGAADERMAAVDNLAVAAGLVPVGGPGAAAKPVPAWTDAELVAAHKSCKNLVNHHHAALIRQVWRQANDYFHESRILARQVLSKIKSDADDADEYLDPPSDDEDIKMERTALHHTPPNKLIPADALCLDSELLCSFWASMGECKANPKYMVGTSRKQGHCRASCGRCKADNSWRQHPLARKELSAMVSSRTAQLRSAACTASKACMAGSASTTPGGGAAAMQSVPDLLPGAALAKMPGFVLGKPFWDIPSITVDQAGGGVNADEGNVADQVLVSDMLTTKHVSINGMDGYFVYQLHYKKRVYQYHLDKTTGQVTEEHVLGLYSAEATAAASKKDATAAALNSDAVQAWLKQQEAFARLDSKQSQQPRQTKGRATLQQGKPGEQDHTATGSNDDAQVDGSSASKHKQPSSGSDGGPGKASTGKAANVGVTDASLSPPPMLDWLDYLPDTGSMAGSWWPCMRQMYTEGEMCTAEGRGRPRQVELRVACSPDKKWHMLVREPEFCKYIMVLYHPLLCSVPAYKPVPRTAASGSQAAAPNTT
eukprot:GHRR01022642.1.p1 GENE.GHRR01022642.1~~GHRR01022642.1.p1  ORF type:complete len:613 (+),score=206.25 GHRR01022642.1:336-2174(+)